MDKGAWQAIVHGVAQSRTRLKRLSVYVCTFVISPFLRECVTFQLKGIEVV